MPAGTVNAIALVVDYLLDNRLCSEEEARALEMLRRLHASTDGSSVGIAAQDDVFDPLTCVGGVISWKTARCAKASTSVSPPAPMPRRCAPRCRSWRRTRAAASCRTAPVFRSISTPIPRSSRRSSGRTTM